MNRFFRLPPGDGTYLVVVLLFAVVALMPFAREVEVGGMALLGWMMAALMVLSPVVALVRIGIERRAESGDREAP